MKRFQHKFTLPLILTMLVLAVGALFIGFFNFKKQTTLPNDSNASAIGVELNQEFGYIDLHKLQANGISFIYLRATQGRTYFDDDYLTYRSQVQGTKLAFGTEIFYSNESTPEQHYQYFMKKVGTNCGSLPLLIIPTSSSKNHKYLRAMSKLVQLLDQLGKKVMVNESYRYHNLFPKGTQFLISSNNRPNTMQYAFWRYTTTGRVKNVNGLDSGVTMFAYNGTVSQYKQKYGQLTQ